MSFLEGPWNTLLVHPLLTVFVALFDLFHDFGLAIILVTVGIRLVLYPLFVAQIRSQRAMQELAPAMNELKAKYGKDRQRMSEEQMKLYKERGYNPAMGCLPLLVQMPILFAMYAAFIQAGGGVGQAALTGAEYAKFLPSFVSYPLGLDQPLDTAAHWLPWMTAGLAQADPLHVLPVLAGASQLIASLMAQPAKQPVTDDPQAKMMQSMVYYFPLITVFIAWGLPAGLGLYWVTTTLFQMVQQYFVTGWGRLPRFVPAPANIPSPGERALGRRQVAALAEERADMAALDAQERKPQGQPKDPGKGGGRKRKGGRR